MLLVRLPDVALFGPLSRSFLYSSTPLGHVFQSTTVLQNAKYGLRQESLKARTATYAGELWVPHRPVIWANHEQPDTGGLYRQTAS